MTPWEVQNIDSGLIVRADRPRPVLSATVEAAVAAVWARAQAARPALFNGDVLSVDSASPTRIDGHWTEYRRALARIERADLATVLAVRPLAVAGLIEGPDGVVFGRRPERAVYQPGLWQLAPAGNVDREAARGDSVDPVAALLIELREELGLDADCVRDPRPLCLVSHPHVGVMDLCIALTTPLSGESLRHRHQAAGNDEYPELAIVPRTELASFIADQGPRIAPQVIAFLNRYPTL